MAKTTDEIYEEFEIINNFLLTALKQDYGIYAIDFMYFAQRINDLKQELRIAEARENI